MPNKQKNSKSSERIAFVVILGSGLALILLITALSVTYKKLNQSVLDERIAYVSEISAQIIVSHAFMTSQYTNTILDYATILDVSKPNTLQNVRVLLNKQKPKTDILNNKEDILLISTEGKIAKLDGTNVFLSDRSFIQKLMTSTDVVNAFTSIKSSELGKDYWLFASSFKPITIDGTEYTGIILAISSQEYRKNLSIMLFEGQGASYIITKDGRILVKPERDATFFGGYNLLESFVHRGIPEKIVDKIAEDMVNDKKESYVLQFDQKKWLISYSPLDTTCGICVTIPLSLTAAKTYDGFVNTIFYAVAIVGTIAFAAITSIIMLFRRDRERRHEAMIVAAKSDFFSKMSHDIRTPLNAVIGMEMLAKENIDNKELVLSYLHKSTSAANYLLSIINDVLDMNRIESGKIIISGSPFNMNTLVEDVSNVILPTAEEKKVQFFTKQNTVFTSMHFGDVVRIKQILVNLLSNSVKFTKTGGSIQLGVSGIDTKDGCDLITFTVSDNGIGMSEAYLSRIFMPFEQERSSYTEQYTGSGLGLSIVHNLVLLMGGTITVESTVNVGSTFTVKIPLKRDKTIKEEQSKKETIAISYRGKHALLAEDNAMNQEIITAILQNKFGIIVDIAENGEQAVEKFAASPDKLYDIIFLDVKMPVMDGLTACRNIRALQRKDASCIPIAALSANAFEEDKEASLKAGMNEHLAKPIDMAALSAVLEKYLSKGTYEN